MKSAPRISVIIPTYNEQDTIGGCLNQFHTVSDDHEVIVVDGGSSDGTCGIVESTVGIRLVPSPLRGRAVQMNAGAEVATGIVLVFLHADTRLPRNWHSLVTNALAPDGTIGGRFRLSISQDSATYRWIARGINFRSQVLGISYGDQAIFATRDAFDAVAGYPDIPIFEDSEFCARLKKTGSFVWVDEPVVTSARRWQRHGPIRTLLLTWFLRLLFMLFVSPAALSRFYRAVR